MEQLAHLHHKIVSRDQANRLVSMWHMKGETVVFTNGCFDVLHKGHISYLAKASDLGSRLIVAVNTDSSVKQQNKGDDRPVNPEEARALLIAALGFVDLVVFIDEKTPYQLIELLLPDVLVKGADYDPDETDPAAKKYIVGSDIVKKNGGNVVVIDFVDGFSSTSIINRLKNN
jgi:rfaE bifunctional protein nucleotidyltransferase chain/domain